MHARNETNEVMWTAAVDSLGSAVRTLIWQLSSDTRKHISSQRPPDSSLSDHSLPFLTHYVPEMSLELGDIQTPSTLSNARRLVSFRQDTVPVRLLVCLAHFGPDLLASRKVDSALASFASLTRLSGHCRHQISRQHFSPVSRQLSSVGRGDRLVIDILRVFRVDESFQDGKPVRIGDFLRWRRLLLRCLRVFRRILCSRVLPLLSPVSA